MNAASATIPTRSSSTSADTWRGVVSPDRVAAILVIALAVVLWIPRHAGPIDLRFDGSVYYTLGTSLAQGKGYRLLNEPGEIAAVQYPPLLPAIVAAHELILGSTDPTTVGRWLRLTSFLVFITWAVVVLRFLKSYVPVSLAVLGTLLSLFCLHAWFLSDALYPELWFSVATLLFLIFVRRGDGVVPSAVAYVCAVTSYALRTIGVAAFLVWVLDSLVRRRFKQAAIRFVLVLVPILMWQTYIASVEHSSPYINPAYTYQRAPYLFYNVTYARNIALRDPFTPEKGDVRIVRRAVRNMGDLARSLGEALSAPLGYFQMMQSAFFGARTADSPIAMWGLFIVLSAFGAVLVGGGVTVLLLRREWIPAVYILSTLAVLLVTPFPQQFLRYLMPIGPLLALAAIVFLCAVPGARSHSSSHSERTRLAFRVLGPALLVEVLIAAFVFATEYRPVTYVDAAGKVVAYRMFFYDDSKRGFDRAIDYVQAYANSTDIVAAGTPHWIYLRTGLKAVMPPFERDADEAERLLDSVPVTYLLIGRDVVASERYTAPVVERHPKQWEPVYVSDVGDWTVYKRVDRSASHQFPALLAHPADPADVLLRHRQKPLVD